MPNLSLSKNIQDGSVGFSDETLKKYGWVDAKEFWLVGLLAFFATLSPEQRQSSRSREQEEAPEFESDNRGDGAGTKKYGERRELVEWKDLKTGETELVQRGATVMRERTRRMEGCKDGRGRRTWYRGVRRTGRELVEWEDVKTGETYMIPRSTAHGRELVEWEDVKTGETQP